jgi:hypothetical protein
LDPQTTRATDENPWTTRTADENTWTSRTTYAYANFYGNAYSHLDAKRHADGYGDKCAADKYSDKQCDTLRDTYGQYDTFSDNYEYAGNSTQHINCL